MPTYEYACSACGHELEVEQRITADPLKKCPECGKLKLRRLVGSGNFVLKGGGWYSDLYSGPSNRGSSSSKKKKKDTSTTSSSSSSGGSGGSGGKTGGKD